MLMAMSFMDRPACLPAGEIAFLVGQDKTSSFLGAFSRRSGTTPKRLRRASA
jgi:methylphosphotriester-DNA--protein-cysteine methyltransferase